jgi:type IX secretion system substrate protein
MMLVINVFVFSQAHYLKQAIIVNGGMYETSEPTDFVTVASFDPYTGITTVFDTIFTQSTQCVIVDDKYAFVAAEDSIVKYDLDTYERVGEVKMGGVNQLKIHNNYLIVGRQWPASNKLIKILDKNDLSEIIAFEAISGDTYGIVVKNDTAYVAINGGWAGTEGRLAQIHLGSPGIQLIDERILGEQAMGISQLYLKDDWVYSVNKSPYGAGVGSFSAFNTITYQVTSTTIDFFVGDGIDLVNNTLYVQLDGNIGSFDIETKEINESIIEDNNDTLDILGAAFDGIQNQFFVNFSSYGSAGIGKVYNVLGEEVDTYEVGISAQAIALDYRISVDIVENNATEVAINTFPNPCTDFINITALDRIKSIQLIDLSGKSITSIYNVNTSFVQILTNDLKSGIYIINVKTKQGIVSKRIIKK